ncbi:hypothetical protein [Mesorhizobium sp.]|uniref:hypothetical protein n=1 Tax=Mesorhizobium sp. TaxID=1871066 RepID=UPI00257BCB47|nr:hypothetical protein [Mesorhizobium sp.]
MAPDEIEKVRAAGYGDAEIVEIIAHVALNTFTNYVNEALGTEIDFPRIDRLAARPTKGGRFPATALPSFQRYTNKELVNVPSAASAFQ